MKKIVDGRLDYDEMVKESCEIATRMAKLFDIEPPEPLKNKNKTETNKFSINSSECEKKEKSWVDAWEGYDIPDSLLPKD